MNTFKKHMALAITVLMILASCANGYDDFGNEQQPEKKSIVLSEMQKKMRDNNNDFACRLFRAINEVNGDNSLFMSPISVSYVLGMLNAGADGETRDQIMDVLGLGNDAAAINAYFKKMIDEAPYVDPSVTLKIANAIDVNSALDVNLNPQYASDMKGFYDAQIGALDFSKSTTLDIINNWCDTHTDGMIPNILDEVDARAVMYLMNAIYFKAIWTEKFDPKETCEKNFTTTGGQTVKCQMMHRLAPAKYGHNELYSALCLPYGSGGYSMYVLLPNEGKTVDDVIQSLTGEGIDQLDSEMSSQNVDVLLPRFTTSSDIRLEGILSSMGMPLAFTGDAEFPNMVVEKYDLYVSMMKQKAKIEVNEDGTKAAAVTIAAMKTFSASGNDYTCFHATRPFVYFIMEASTRSIFFMGTYQGN